MEHLLDETHRLDREEQEEEDRLRERSKALQKAQADLNESLAKLDRLRQQKRMVFKKGMSVAEESDPPSAESEAVVEVQSSGGLDVIDWDAVFRDAEMVGFEGSPGAMLASS